MTNKTDRLHRILFETRHVRGAFIRLTDSWQKILSHTVYPKPAIEQLGQALAASVLLSNTIKFDGSLILQIQGNGPLSTLVAQATNEKTIRGLVKWRSEPQGESVTDLFGQGHLTMSLVNPGQQPYQGIVALDGDKISDALETYFFQSEQLKTRFWLAANEQHAIGMMVQQLPEENYVESNSEEDWERINYLAETITHDEMFNLSTEQLLYRLFHEEQVRLVDDGLVRFSCNCSRDRISQTLMTLGQTDLEELIAEQGEVAVTCEFCNQRYSFDKVDVTQLFAAQPLIPADKKTTH